MKKVLPVVLAASVGLTCAACGSSSKSKNNAEVIPTVYSNVSSVSDMTAWANEVLDSTGNIDLTPKENGIVKSPYFELTVNGTAVPVYTSRCYTSPHNFAWVDVKGAPSDFNLEIKLTTQKTYTQAIVLPEKHGVTAKVSGQTVTTSISQYGDYSFAFAAGNEKYPSVYNEPFTLYVAPEEPLQVPEGWTVKTFNAGVHSREETNFTEENTVYRFTEGLHEIDYIELPSNSILYFDRGAYVAAYADEGNPRGWANDRVIGSFKTENVKILGRGLIDMSGINGGQDKPKEAFLFVQCKNIVYSGLTHINPQTWTLQFYACTNAEATRLMQFGYRKYSDGILFAECINSSARYCFYRTGDDAFEVKGIGLRQKDENGNSIPQGDERLQLGNNILFEECTSWMDRTASFGVTWENTAPFTNVAFRNCSVGFATAVWGGYNSALDVRLGQKAGILWKGITFENIEIYECWSTAMTMQFYDEGGLVEDVTFKNITVKRSPKARPAVKIGFIGNKGYDYYKDPLYSGFKNVTFENIDFCGKSLAAEDMDDEIYFVFDPDTAFMRSEITVK